MFCKSQSWGLGFACCFLSYFTISYSPRGLILSQEREGFSCLLFFVVCAVVPTNSADPFFLVVGEARSRGRQRNGLARALSSGLAASTGISPAVSRQTYLRGYIWAALQPYGASPFSAQDLSCAVLCPWALRVYVFACVFVACFWCGFVLSGILPYRFCVVGGSRNVWFLFFSVLEFD